MRPMKNPSCSSLPCASNSASASRAISLSTSKPSSISKKPSTPRTEISGWKSEPSRETGITRHRLQIKIRNPKSLIGNPSLPCLPPASSVFQKHGHLFQIPSSASFRPFSFQRFSFYPHARLRRLELRRHSPALVQIFGKSRSSNLPRASQFPSFSDEEHPAMKPAIDHLNASSNSHSLHLSISASQVFSFYPRALYAGFTFSRTRLLPAYENVGNRQDFRILETRASRP